MKEIIIKALNVTAVSSTLNITANVSDPNINITTVNYGEDKPRQSGLFQYIPDTVNITDSLITDSTTSTVIPILGYGTDNMSMTETVRMEVGKSLSDNMSTAETVSMAVSKIIEDVINLSDSVSTSKPGDITGAGTDNASMTETISIGVDKPLSDNMSAAETVSIDVSKVIQDPVNASDLAITEKIITTLQNYFSETYVSENYVGVTTGI